MASRDASHLRLVDKNESEAIEAHWEFLREQVRPVTEALFKRLGSCVQAGPFEGMDVSIYKTPVWDDSNTPAKLIGSYEFELHDAIRKAVSRKPDCVINAGCAEGYYAIGLARLLPQAIVFAMDESDKALDACERNAWLNDVGRARLQTVTGKVGPQDLMHGHGKKLYMVDIEGWETNALDPIGCPDLLSSDIIVECHDFFVFDGHELISETIRKRFSATHDVEIIDPQIPDPNAFPFLRGLPYGLILLVISERRPLQTTWLACWSKQGEDNG